ncbi:hypothetical protein [Methyloprofundus sp.]|uniref:hypothetical protein n=1 Tax=Methyloprofundus sp. TaxID=2020875 RepID=UPI003D14BE6D
MNTSGGNNCECHKCITNKELKINVGQLGKIPINVVKMIVCDECGNKRCPKASDHNLNCTGSNEVNQSGSVYCYDYGT